MNLRGTQLGIVEEQGGFGGTVVRVSLMKNRMMAAPSYVSFSKLTDADFGASAASDDGVTEREFIFPLWYMSELHLLSLRTTDNAYQKLKKSLTSFSLVWEDIP